MSLAAVPVYLLASRLGLSVDGTAYGDGRDRPAGDAVCLVDPGRAVRLPARARCRRDGLGRAGRRGPPEPCRLSVARHGRDPRPRPARRAAALLRSTTFVVGLRRRDLLAAVRQQKLVLFGFVLPLGAVLLLSPERVLGTYGAFTQVHIGLGGLTDQLGANGFVFLFAAGWVVLPGALFGLWLAVARPRSDLELAFGALVGALALVLLLQASLYGDLDRAQGRYVFYLIPLVALLFCLYASRGWPHARAYALLAASGLVLSATIPLSGFAADSGKSQSVFLFGVFRVEQLLGTGAGALTVALVAEAGSVLAVLLPRARGAERRSASPRRSPCFSPSARSRRASTPAIRMQSGPASSLRMRAGSTRHGSGMSRSSTSRGTARTRSRSSSGTTP